MRSFIKQKVKYVFLGLVITTAIGASVMKMTLKPTRRHV